MRSKNERQGDESWFIVDCERKKGKEGRMMIFGEEKKPGEKYKNVFSVSNEQTVG